MDCIENFPSGLFSRKGHPALVLTHLAFIDAGKLGKTTGIDKVEIFEERRHVITERHLILLGSTITVSDGQFTTILDTFAEIGLRFLDSVSKAAKVISAKTFFLGGGDVIAYRPSGPFSIIAVILYIVFFLKKFSDAQQRTL